MYDTPGVETTTATERKTAHIPSTETVTATERKTAHIPSTIVQHQSKEALHGAVAKQPRSVQPGRVVDQHSPSMHRRPIHTQALILLSTTECTHFMILFCCSMPRLIGLMEKMFDSSFVKKSKHSVSFQNVRFSSINEQGV